MNIIKNRIHKKGKQKIVHLNLGLWDYEAKKFLTRTSQRMG